MIAAARRKGAVGEGRGDFSNEFAEIKPKGKQSRGSHLVAYIS